MAEPVRHLLHRGAGAEPLSFVLTGKASTIQRQRRVLKDCGVPGARILAKTYWAAGKKGRD